MIICSALCALYITRNFSLKIFFQGMSARLKVKDCIFVVFKLFITVSSLLPCYMIISVYFCTVAPG